MAAMDYCYWADERCRFVEGPDRDTRWVCLFHTAFESGDIERMARELLDPEYESNRFPVGVSVESAERRPDGSYAFVVVAMPDSEDISHPILKVMETVLTRPPGPDCAP